MESILDSEIREQPEVLARLLADGRHAEVAAAIRAADPRHILIAARGSSDNAARYAQYLFGIHCGLPVSLAAPSITTQYGKVLHYRDTVVIGISQSGRSPDVGQVLTDAASQGALTIAITNDGESPMATAAKYHLALNAGAERSVAATKTYTAQLTTLALLTAHLVDDSTMHDDLARLPQLIEKALDPAADIAKRAERFRFMNFCVMLGRGYNYATTFEIALKLKELSYVVAEPYSSADFRHGPKAMIETDFPVIAIAPNGAIFTDILALLTELKERGADLTVISEQAEALTLAAVPIPLPLDMPEWLSPIVAVVPGQLLAMSVAAAKGLALDTPRNLTKVTVTH